MSLKFDVAEDMRGHALFVDTAQTNIEVGATESELRRLLVDLMHAVGPVDEGAEDASMKTYNPNLDRKGYFCDVCGHEANDADGLRQYASLDDGGVLNVCKSRCLDS